MVQEIDSIKYTLLDSTSEEIIPEEEEDIPPLPQEFLEEKELSPQEQEAKRIYEAALTMLNKTKPDKKQAYLMLIEAAEKGNNDAKALVAWGKLFGSSIPQNLEEAKDIFHGLAGIGHPEGHMGLGFLYATGLTVNVSQAKALVHYTFGAVGGSTWAQMALGYRYWSGITLSPGCERALDFYRQVADKGMFYI